MFRDSRWDELSSVRLRSLSVVWCSLSVFSVFAESTTLKMSPAAWVLLCFSHEWTCLHRGWSVCRFCRFLYVRRLVLRLGGCEGIARSLRLLTGTARMLCRFTFGVIPGLDVLVGVGLSSRWSSRLRIAECADGMGAGLQIPLLALFSPLD